MDNVLPERGTLKPLGPHSVLGGNDFGLGARVKHAGLFLADHGHGDEGVRADDGDEPTGGALEPFLVPCEIGVAVVQRVAVLRVITHETLIITVLVDSK